MEQESSSTAAEQPMPTTQATADNADKVSSDLSSTHENAREDYEDREL
jgi:hypothetical protein